MIRILDRYIARDFLKLFGLVFVVLMAISRLVHLFENLHRYLRSGASASTIMNYYFYTMPRESLLVAPVALLIASFLSVGKLSQNFEFLSMQMARVHPLRAILPIIVLTLGITLGLYIVQEEIAPKASEAALRIRHERIKKRASPFHRTRSQDIWYLAERTRILHIGFLDTRKGEMQEISLFEFSPDFRLVQRTEARTARWRDGRWILADAKIRRFSGDGTEMQVAEVPEMPIQLQATPADLARVEKKVEEMSYRELKRYIKRLTRSGVDARHYVADLLAKPAMLAVNLVMALLGIAFAFRVGRQGLLVQVGTCIIVAFLYWLLFSIALPLARNEVLPPLLVVWLPNMIFGSVAVLGLVRTRPRV